jgi:hypothetical protein
MDANPDSDNIMEPSSFRTRRALRSNQREIHNESVASENDEAPGQIVCAVFASCSVTSATFPPLSMQMTLRLLSYCPPIVIGFYAIVCLLTASSLLLLTKLTDNHLSPRRI